MPCATSSRMRCGRSSRSRRSPSTSNRACTCIERCVRETRCVASARAMSVYVDDAVVHWRDRRWAHLMADTLDELHAFAARLGIPRRAFQDKASGAHYDVTAELRDEAIRLGAV